MPTAIGSSARRRLHPSCQFGCSDWRTELKAEAAGHGCEPAKVEAAVQLLERRSVLPMATKKGDMFMSYEEASKLPTTDERDLPSRAAALAGAKKTETRRWAELARHPRARPPCPAGATRTATRRTTSRTAARRRLPIN